MQSTTCVPEMTYYMAKTRAQGTSGGDITGCDQELLDESIAKEECLVWCQDEWAPHMISVKLVTAGDNGTLESLWNLCLPALDIYGLGFYTWTSQP